MWVNFMVCWLYLYKTIARCTGQNYVHDRKIWKINTEKDFIHCRSITQSEPMEAFCCICFQFFFCLHIFFPWMYIVYIDASTVLSCFQLML